MLSFLSFCHHCPALLPGLLFPWVQQHWSWRSDAGQVHMGLLLLPPLPGSCECLSALSFPRLSPSFVEPLGRLWQHQARIEGKELCKSHRGWLCCVSPLVWPPLCLGSAAQGRAGKLDVLQLKKCSGSQCGFTRWDSSACTTRLHWNLVLLEDVFWSGFSLESSNQGCFYFAVGDGNLCIGSAGVWSWGSCFPSALFSVLQKGGGDMGLLLLLLFIKVLLAKMFTFPPEIMLWPILGIL